MSFLFMHDISTETLELHVCLSILIAHYNFNNIYMAFGAQYKTAILTLPIYLLCGLGFGLDNAKNFA